MRYSEEEKELLVQKFRELLDSGDDWEVFEHAEPIEQWIDLYPKGGISFQGLSRRIRTTHYMMGVKKTVREEIL